METTITDLMTHIATWNIGQYYTVAKTTYDNDDKWYGIFYTDGKWRIDDSNHETVREFNNDNIIDVFNVLNLDISRFHADLHSTSLLIGMYSKRVWDATAALVGEEAISKTINDWDDFGKKLVETVTKVLNKPKLSIVEES